MKIFDIFRRPSLEAEAQARLDKAKRDLMGAQEAVEYATSLVGYHEATIKRLEAHLGQPMRPEPRTSQGQEPAGQVFYQAAAPAMRVA
jgi:hypothetical protein